MERFSFIFFLYFGKWNFPASTLKFLIFFPKKIHSEKISYIFSKNAFLKLQGNGAVIFWEMELLAPISKLQNKKTHSENISYTSGNGTF